MKTVLVLEGTGHDPQGLQQLLAGSGYVVNSFHESSWPLPGNLQEQEPDNGCSLINVSAGMFRSSLEGKLLSINPAGALMFGYASPREMIDEVNRRGIDEALYAHPGHRREILRQVLASEDWRLYEEPFRRRDGSLACCLFHLRALRRGDEQIVELEGLVVDISARKEIERALQFTQFSIDKTIDQAFWMTEDQRFFYVNEAACRALGYTREELLQLSLTDIDPTFSKDQLKQGWRILKEKGFDTLESWHRTKEGRMYPVEIRANYVVFDGKEYNCAFVTDISERRNNEEQTRLSLREKEVLLREIHHRVKNNLQIISSLLYLQSQKLTDPELKNHFLEGQSRICSMALAHEQLYQSDSLAQINMKSYLGNLVCQLHQVFQAPGQQIDCRMEIADIILDIGQVVPCGLLITELLSNAYRHAFIDGRNGVITISMERQDGQLLLTVSDNGVGLPADLDCRKARTLGLQLVGALVKQLNGTMEIGAGTGTMFQVTFSA